MRLQAGILASLLLVNGRVRAESTCFAGKSLRCVPGDCCAAYALCNGQVQASAVEQVAAGTLCYNGTIIPATDPVCAGVVCNIGGWATSSPPAPILI